LEYQVRDGFGRVALADARPDGLADVVVLAEDAAEVAVAEEDGAGAVPAPEAVLFAEVGEGAGDHGVAAGLARGPLVGQPVDPAIAGADPAVGQSRDGAADAFPELAGGELEVGGDEIWGGGRGHGTSRKRERHDIVSKLRSQVAVSPSGDHDVLLPVELVRHRRRLAS